MTGKILAGVSLSLALVTCVAMGVQGGDNDWENGCVQETCGTEGQKMTEQVRPLEIIVDEPDMEDIPEQNEDDTVGRPLLWGRRKALWNGYE